MSDAMSFGAIGGYEGRLLDFWEEGMGWQKVDGSGACNVGVATVLLLSLSAAVFGLCLVLCGGKWQHSRTKACGDAQCFPTSWSRFVTLWRGGQWILPVVGSRWQTLLKAKWSHLCWCLEEVQVQGICGLESGSVSMMLGIFRCWYGRGTILSYLTVFLAIASRLWGSFPVLFVQIHALEPWNKAYKAWA